jgi:hypothetical protein
VDEYKTIIENWCNYTDRGKPKYLGKKMTLCPWTGLGTNVGLRGTRPATNILHHLTTSLGKRITWPQSKPASGARKIRPLFLPVIAKLHGYTKRVKYTVEVYVKKLSTMSCD